MNLIDDYYIIESLGKNDVKGGSILNDCLKSIEGFNPIYKQVKSLKEFKDSLQNFMKSGYRYLFISAHGDEENILLNNEDVNVEDIAEVDIKIEGRRVFMSTCFGGSYLIAKQFIKKGAYSVIGPPEPIAQIVAAGMWPTMVIIFDRISAGGIGFWELNRSLQLLSEFYEIDLRYFSFIRKNKSQMKEYVYSHESNRKRIEHEI